MDIFKPVDELSSFIEMIWRVEHRSNPAEIRKIIPEGICEIIINLGDPYELSYEGKVYDTLDGINLFFMRTSVNYLKQGKHAHAVGIRMKPFGLYILTGQPLAEYRYDRINLNSVLPELHDKLINGIDYHGAFINHLNTILLEEYQSKAARSNPLIEAIYDQIELYKGVISVGFLMGKFDVSYKQFERLFSKYIGVPPKKYIRFRRMHYALNEINDAKNKPDFMSIVNKYAFHDQAHMIREFTKLTGVSPLLLYNKNNTLQKFYKATDSV